MRGKYSMMDWEQAKWRNYFQKAIERMANNPQHLELLTNYDLCPYNVYQILKALGWDLAPLESDDDDYWETYSHPEHQFKLTFYYNRSTFQMELSRADAEELIPFDESEE